MPHWENELKMNEGPLSLGILAEIKITNTIFVSADSFGECLNFKTYDKKIEKLPLPELIKENLKQFGDWKVKERAERWREEDEVW